MFYSSSEVYGDPSPDMIPTKETYRGYVSFTGPRSCYDESKRYGETLCVNFAQQHDLPITISRPFNNYGPGLKITDKRVISDFARDVFEGRDHRVAVRRCSDQDVLLLGRCGLRLLQGTGTWTTWRTLQRWYRNPRNLHV